jgi:hypothetical protein
MNVPRTLVILTMVVFDLMLIVMIITNVPAILAIKNMVVKMKIFVLNVMMVIFVRMIGAILYLDV